MQSKKIIYSNDYTAVNPDTSLTEPFPVSVNTKSKTITPNQEADEYFTKTIAQSPSAKKNWWNKVASVFSTNSLYQNLASPVSRIIVIWPGERKEQIIKNISDILGWTEEQEIEFASLIDTSYPITLEGKYFPGQYVTHKEATPKDLFEEIETSFDKEILSRYTPEVEASVPIEEALVIASLLEREASDFNNMRQISGVIWNRLFIDMPLQLDATLQYVRGGNETESKWWPKVRPEDKYLDSPFNTYKNHGLPPSPIANPSPEAILAALNPIVTDCLYYFHTEDSDYHCSENYEDHVNKLQSIYGRGS